MHASSATWINSSPTHIARHLVSLTDFLAYIQTLRDVGFREGEAPTDSSTAGAVQLMTVHKAKGLEFPLTVIADASYEHRGNTGKIQFTDSPAARFATRQPPPHRLATRRPPRRRPRGCRRPPPVLRCRDPRQRKTPHQRLRQTQKRWSFPHRLARRFPFLEMAAPERPLLENGIYAALIPPPEPAIRPHLNPILFRKSPLSF